MSGDAYELERALGELEGGKRYRDRLGPAVYQLEPTWATAILCPACRYVAIIPRLPRKRLFAHECSSCQARITLAPPAEVFDVDPAAATALPSPRTRSIGKPA